MLNHTPVQVLTLPSKELTTKQYQETTAPKEDELSPYLHTIHGHCSKIVGILLIPAETQQWMVLWVLINDGAVLQMTEIKHPH